MLGKCKMTGIIYLIRTHFSSSWLCCYMAQMNPLIGPVLPQRALFAIQQYWVREEFQIVQA